MTPKKYKGLIERVYGELIEFGEQNISNPEKAKAVHELMERDGDRVKSFEDLKEGEFYAAVFGSDGLRLFIMPCKGSVSHTYDFDDIYTDYYEVKSATHETPETEGVVIDGKIRLSNRKSYDKLGVYHLNGHSKLKNDALKELKTRKSIADYVGSKAESD